MKCDHYNKSSCSENPEKNDSIIFVQIIDPTYVDKL
jgi:hypothetical protein